MNEETLARYIPSSSSSSSMDDSVFFFSEAARLDFLQSTVLSYGCAYICLWSYTSSYNRLVFLDGLYGVPSHEESSSSLMGSSVDRRVFGQYRGLEFAVTSDIRVPGVAFWNQYSYLELQHSDLLRFACTDIQRQFFQEARVETAVFIGCCHGEIELGFSSLSHVSSNLKGSCQLQTDFQNLFPEEVSRQFHHQFDHKMIPSSNPYLSSSLLPDEMLLTMQQENNIEHHGGGGGGGGGMIKAMLHDISSPPPSDINNKSASSEERGGGAFKRYDDRASELGRYFKKPNLRRQSLLKRSFELLRGLHFMRTRDQNYCDEASRHTSTQFLHMLSERRRRQKLNRNFQALRSLLPPETKKDKASILIAATETLSSLMAENEKMAKKDDEQGMMKAKREKSKEPFTREETKTSVTDEERLLSVRVCDVAGSSSSEERFVDLYVTVRRRRRQSCYSFVQVDMLRPLLEFFQRVEKVNLISVEATTHIEQGNSIYAAVFRLKIEGSEWDEAAFEEAVKRVVADLEKSPITT